MASLNWDMASLDWEKTSVNSSADVEVMAVLRKVRKRSDIKV